MTVILAAHLVALGWLDSDPPVLVQHPDTGSLLAMHPSAFIHRKPSERDLLAVEQSMPALLRVLARSKGMKMQPGEVPQWYTIGGDWFLQCEGRQAWPFTCHSSVADCWPARSVVPALTADMDRLEALAAVIEWQVTQ